MIGIIQKGEYIKGVLDYHFDKINDGAAEILATNIYSEDYKDQLRFYLNTFSLHQNTRTKDKVFHASLSFSPDETISKELMTKIGEEYLSRMGYKDVPYTIFTHTDTLHQHVHIVASRINYDGNIACKNQFDIKRNKEHCQILERKYGLVIAEQSSKEERKREFLKEINMQKYAVSNAIFKAKAKGEQLPELVISAFKNDRQPTDSELRDLLGKDFYKLKAELERKGFVQYSKKQQLNHILQSALDKANSQDEFTAKCQMQGVYVRKLIHKGVPYFTYGLKDQGFFVSEKYLPERFSYTSTENIANNKEQKIIELEESRHKKYLKTSLNKIIPSIKSQAELEINLKRYNIEFEYDYTKKDGKEVIQGLRLRSGGSRWFKASEVDRNFSWNQIRSTFLPVQTPTDKQKSENQTNDVKIKPKDLTISDNIGKFPSPINDNIHSSSDKTPEELEQRKRKKRNRNQEQ